MADIKLKHHIEVEQAREDGETVLLWIVTYSDMITLLTTFFLLIISMSSVDQKKYSAMMSQFNQALGGSSAFKKGGESKTPTGNLQSVIDSANLQSGVEMSTDSRGTVMFARGDIVFQPASAVLTDDIKRLLSKLCGVISESNNRVLVEGHTDDTQVNSSMYPTNWELSTARAAAVVRYFVEECKINPNRFTAAGYAEYKPRYPILPENREKNRRIEIVLLRSQL